MISHEMQSYWARKNSKSSSCHNPILLNHDVALFHAATKNKKEYLFIICMVGFSLKIHGIWTNGAASFLLLPSWLFSSRTTTSTLIITSLLEASKIIQFRWTVLYSKASIYSRFMGYLGQCHEQLRREMKLFLSIKKWNEKKSPQFNSSPLLLSVELQLSTSRVDRSWKILLCWRAERSTISLQAGLLNDVKFSSSHWNYALHLNLMG